MAGQLGSSKRAVLCTGALAAGIVAFRRQQSVGAVIKSPAGGLQPRLQECPAGPAELLGLSAGAQAVPLAPGAAVGHAVSGLPRSVKPQP